MTNLDCSKCNKTFSSVSNLNKHLKKKKSCTIKEPEMFQCSKCKKVFTTKQNLYTHLNKKNPCIKEEPSAIELEKIRLRIKEADINLETIKLNQIRESIKLAEVTNNTSVINNIMNNNIHVYNNIKSFNEDLTEPTEEEALELYNINENNKTEMTTYMIEKYYGNEDRPENKCIICPDPYKDEIQILINCNGIKKWTRFKYSEKKKDIIIKAVDEFYKQLTNIENSLRYAYVLNNKINKYPKFGLFDIKNNIEKNIVNDEAIKKKIEEKNNHMVIKL